MELTRPSGRGHPSYKVWNEWSNLVNANMGLITTNDDLDSICNKLYDLLIHSKLRYISGDSVIRTAVQIFDKMSI